MSHISILECPVIFTGENQYSMTSIDMCPSVGIARGLVSRHIKVLDARIMAVCIWQDQASCEAFFDPEWYRKATDLWDDRYQLRIEAVEESVSA